MVLFCHAGWIILIHCYECVCRRLSSSCGIYVSPVVRWWNTGGTSRPPPAVCFCLLVTRAYPGWPPPPMTAPSKSGIRTLPVNQPECMGTGHSHPYKHEAKCFQTLGLGPIWGRLGSCESGDLCAMYFLCWSFKIVLYVHQACLMICTHTTSKLPLLATYRPFTHELQIKLQRIRSRDDLELPFPSFTR